MDSRNIFVANDLQIKNELAYMFDNDSTILSWASNPNDWEIIDHQHPDYDNFAWEFDEDEFDAEMASDGIYPALYIAILRPQDLELQAMFKVTKHGVEYTGD